MDGSSSNVEVLPCRKVGIPGQWVVTEQGRVVINLYSILNEYPEKVKKGLESWP